MGGKHLAKILEITQDVRCSAAGNAPCFSRRFPAGNTALPWESGPQGRRGPPFRDTPPLRGGRGVAGFPQESGPHFSLSCQRKVAAGAVEKKAPVPTKWPLAIWRQKRECSETVRLGAALRWPLSVSYRVRRTWVEQRWPAAASWWHGCRFRGCVSDGVASLSAAAPLVVVGGKGRI
jgi:hypothetical protein